MKRIVVRAVLAAVAVVGIVYGIRCVSQYRHNRKLELQGRQLKSGVESAEPVVDDREAVRLYKSLTPSTPEVNLRILQRQWTISLDLLHQISLARYSPSLQGDLSRLYAALNDHLIEMQERCSLVLAESESLPDAIAWRTYNLRGAVKLLRCFLIMETERTWEKAVGMMKDAISDLKLSIEAVDRCGVSTFERNIPRWNLELLHAVEQVRKFELAKVEEVERMDVKENLAAIIPEKGGYAPGEPLQTIVLK